MSTSLFLEFWPEIWYVWSIYGLEQEYIVIFCEILQLWNISYKNKCDISLKKGATYNMVKIGYFELKFSIHTNFNM